MKRLALPLCFILAWPALGMAQTAQLPAHGSSDKPLRPVSKCLHVNNINEWYIVNDTTLIARNGPRRYLIKTTHKCPRLGENGAGVNFHPSNGTMGDWRICGDIGETVSSRYQPPCAIQSVKLISAERFDALEKQAARHGSK
ncbi:MAG TPA: DUF6491 family protein [Oleiagrimonas sp.]|nr:DUF6491 family protein [Oleiagrimonas sp.]